jgi:lipoprotein-anchoring transpeptidase ErfK/SrfK
LQVFLDNAGFAPGKIDGKGGQFTREAILEYQKAHGLPPDGKAQSLPLPETGSALGEYTVTAEDENQVGPAPKDPREQAKQKGLLYGSVLELVSEKFHTTEALLRQLNLQIQGRSPKAGERLRVPNVRPFEIAAAEAKRTDEEAPEAKEKQGGRWLDIDVARKELEVREGDRTVVASFPITPGSSTLPAPKGHWHVQTITFMPKFRYDKEMLFHGQRGSRGIVTPPGPNNKVGVVWMNLNKKGVGIHGTDEPDSIGRTTSHGCIRLANWDVVRVAALVEPGATVIIH